MVNGELIDCMSREVHEIGAGPVDSGAERVAGDVEGHGHQGHGGDDALDLEAQGLIGGDLEVHDCGGGVVPGQPAVRA